MNRYTVSRGDKRHYDLSETLMAFEQDAHKRGIENGKENQKGSALYRSTATVGILSSDSPLSATD